MFSTVNKKSSRVTMSPCEDAERSEENIAKVQHKINFMNLGKVRAISHSDVGSAKEDIEENVKNERTLNKLQQLFLKGEILHKAPKPILLDFLGVDCIDGSFHMCENIWKERLDRSLEDYLNNLSKLKNNVVFSVVKNAGDVNEERFDMTLSSYPDDNVYTSYISHVLNLDKNDTLTIKISLYRDFNVKCFNLMLCVITLVPYNSVGRERHFSHTEKNVSVTPEEYTLDLSKSDRLNFTVNENNEIVVLDSDKYTVSIQTTGHMDSLLTFEDDLSILPDCLFKDAFLYGLRNREHSDDVSAMIKDFVYDHIKIEDEEKRQKKLEEQKELKDRQIEEDRQRILEEQKEEEDKKESFWHKFDKMIDSDPIILSDFVKHGDLRKVLTKDSSKKLRFVEKVCLNKTISTQSKQLVLYLYLNLLIEEKFNPHTSLSFIVSLRMLELIKIFYLLFPRFTASNIHAYSNITIFDSMKTSIDTSDVFYEFLRNKDRIILTEEEREQYRAYLIDNKWSDNDRLSVDDLQGQTFSDVYKRYNEIKDFSYFKLVKEDYDGYFSTCEWPLDYYQEFVNYFNYKNDCWGKFLHSINIGQALYLCKMNISHNIVHNRSRLNAVDVPNPKGTSPFDIIMCHEEAIERRYWSEYLTTRKLRTGENLPEDVICEIKKRQAQCEMYKLTFHQQNIETLREKIVFGRPIY